MRPSKVPLLVFSFWVFCVSLFPPRILELVVKRTNQITIEHKYLGHGFLYSAGPGSELENAYGIVGIDWERYILELAAGGTLIFLISNLWTIIHGLRFKKPPSIIQNDARSIFTDDVVCDILAGKPGITVNGKGYIVHKDSLVSAEKIRHHTTAADGSVSSILIGASIPFPKELKELLSQRDQERNRPS